MKLYYLLKQESPKNPQLILRLKLFSNKVQKPLNLMFNLENTNYLQNQKNNLLILNNQSEELVLIPNNQIQLLQIFIQKE
ncbi:unnamed protein product [Paramecium sonneborni]|uniref:Uncharacterized protein n=1 Tax=Paramecium sonneborni TaxID=65129 RepID=A0A8S1KST3_9CILI|nr:unnamed protein product [Paramecium sonneborni]